MCTGWCYTVGGKRCAEPCLRRRDITNAILPTTRRSSRHETTERGNGQRNHMLLPHLRVNYAISRQADLLSWLSCFLTDRSTGRQGPSGARLHTQNTYLPKIPHLNTHPSTAPISPNHRRVNTGCSSAYLCPRHDTTTDATRRVSPCTQRVVCSLVRLAS
jgi:hypothetical protein